MPTSQSLEPVSVTVQDTKDSESVIQLRILRQGSYSGLCEWTQHNYKGPHKR